MDNDVVCKFALGELVFSLWLAIYPICIVTRYTQIQPHVIEFCLPCPSRDMPYHMCSGGFLLQKLWRLSQML